MPKSLTDGADLEADQLLDTGALVSWLQLRDSGASFVVVGAAGTGKTTLLRHDAFFRAEALAKAGARWGDARSLIPVILRAGELATMVVQGASLKECVQKKIVSSLRLAGVFLESQALEILNGCIARTWEQHGFRVLIDALDELTSDDLRRAVLEGLHAHLASSGCSFVLVSRPMRHGNPLLVGARTLYLAPFNPTRDIPRFIRNWFLAVPGGARIQNELTKTITGNRNLADVCRTPLLLAFLCLTAEHGDAEAPVNRVGFYQNLLTGLLITWPNRQGFRRRFSDVKLRVLRHIGWTQLAHPELLAGSELTADLQQAFGEEYGWSYRDIDDLLTELTDVDGILRIQQSFLASEYRLFHPSVGEYLAALEAAQQAAAGQSLVSSISDVRWHGAFVMFVGMSSDPLPLIRRVTEGTPVDGLAQSQLLDACVSECRDRVPTDLFLEFAWAAQSIIPLPWTRLAAPQTVSSGLERRAADDAPSSDMLQLLDETRQRRISPPRGPRSTAGPLRHGTQKGLAALGSDFALTRWTALWVLAIGGDRRTAPTVVPLVFDPSPAIRGMAAWLLGFLDYHRSTGALRGLLSDTEWMVRRTAASSLGQLKDAGACEELLRIAEVDRLEVRRSAAWSLARLAQSSSSALGNREKLATFFLRLIEASSDPDLVGSGCAGVAGLKKTGVAVECDLRACWLKLQALLDHADTGVRGSAAYAISLLANRGDVPVLVSMIDNSDARVRASAASGLGRLGHVESRDALVQLLTDLDSRVRNAAVWALHSIPDQEQVIAALLQALNSVDERAGMRLISGLAQYGNDALKGATQDRAVEFLKNEDPGVRASACVVLQELPDERAVEPCLKLLEDEDPRVRASACAVLQELSDKRAVEPCLKLLEDEDPRVRASACFVLQRVPDERAVEPCLKLLEDEDPRVRASACGLVIRLTLAEFQRTKAHELVRALVTDTDPRVRQSAEFAARALGPSVPRRSKL